ncbi:MAG: U32 family peptidase C-terminal domain-containing protein, partial [Chitinivibrionales bacterium]|nr:U32 family peptidase C-terminal domain-containing protein [Chitinivibrionales bacterium]
DACIVSDPGVLSLCKEYLPTIAVHLSTQTGTFNSAAVRFWADQGIGRVILPRELTLEQIRLCANTACGCETEVFIHGAMCVSISGRCLLGAYLSSRHANHGDCPQPCRLAYEIKPLYSGSESKDIRFTAQEDENGVFLLNSKDLNAVAILPALIATGVTALKIEGRNKSINYISTVVKVYRQAIDRCLQEGGTYAPLPAWIDQLNTIEHRPYTEGFYGGEYQLQAYEGPKSASPLRVVGIVKGCGPHGQSLIDVKNPFLTGDVLSVLPISKNVESFNVTVTSINDYAGNSCHRALTNRIVVIQTAPRLSIGDILRKEVVRCKTGHSAV